MFTSHDTLGSCKEKLNTLHKIKVDIPSTYSHYEQNKIMILYGSYLPVLLLQTLEACS